MLSHLSSGEQSTQRFPKELVTGQYYGLNVESVKKRSKREFEGASRERDERIGAGEKKKIGILRGSHARMTKK